MQGTCSVCKKQKNVHRIRKTRKIVCPSCYRKDPSTHKQCSKCGKITSIATQKNTDQALCYVCNNRSKITICQNCKETKIIQAQGLCYRCYQKQRQAKKIASHA